MVTVSKFGGSSLADAAQFCKVADIINADARREIVVVSAPGKRSSKDEKITDLLYRWHANRIGGFSCDEQAGRFLDRYEGIINSLNLGHSLLNELDETVKAISESNSEAFIVSRGEYLNAKILAAYLGYDFLDSSECIFFNEKGDYQQDDDALRKTIVNRCVVIPGFYGAKRNGDICIFSRGGSDLTGSIVARAVRADLYENWTDTSGLRMAHPGIVNNPHVIEYVTHREMRELSYMGASIFHEGAMFPVQEAGILTQIKNTNSPADPGTFIVPNDYPHANRWFVTGITGRKGFTAITIDKALMDQTRGIAADILTVFKDEEVNIEHVPGGVDYLTVIVADKELLNKEAILLRRLRDVCAPANITSKKLALVVVVGRGMVMRPGTLASIASAIQNAEVNIRMVNQGMMEHSIVIGVDNDDCEKTICAIYDSVTSEA